MDKNKKPAKKELLTFVFVWAAILAATAFYPMIKEAEPKIWAAILSCGFILLLFLPKPLAFVYGLWLRFGSAAGKVSSFAVLFFMFYLIITPLGIVLRVSGKDILNKKIDKESKSYWAKCENRGSMKNQF